MSNLYNFVNLFEKSWDLFSLRSQFNEYIIDKKMFFFAFNIDDDIFTFFEKWCSLDMWEKKI